MKKTEKKQIPLGEQNLQVQFLRFQENRSKVCVIHQALEAGYEPVVRTFTQGSKALGDYTELVAGERKLVLVPEDRDCLEGKLIVGVIKAAKNSPYRDLVAVLQVLDPGALRNPPANINTPTPVTDRLPG